MTIYQRKRQLQRRKDIVCGFITIGMFCAFLGGMFYVAHIADRDIDDALATEVETEVQPIEEPTEVVIAWVDTPIVEMGTEEPATEEVEPETEVVEIVPEEVPEVEKKKYSNQDLEELAHLIYAEVGNQSDTCMKYTGSVVLNRVKSKRFPNTIHKVINQKGQYGVRSYYMKKKPSKRAYSIAKELLEHGSVLPDSVVGQAGAKTAKRYGKIYAKCGRVYFFSLKK